MPAPTVENVVIIGSGPAGYTAAIYAARANLKPLMFEGYQAGGIPGGQLMTTDEVENFPGFPDGITGPQLMARMKAQAIRWGTEIVSDDVTAVDLGQRPFTVHTDEQAVQTHSIIIATGATAKRLGLPNEHQFWSRGISACAICDGAIPLFRSAELAVIGGGDSAAEEAVYLTKYGSHVHLLVRRDRLRASKALQDRVFNTDKITVHWHTEAIAVLGDESSMTGIRIQNNQTGEERDLSVRGLFYAIGHTPNTQIFAGQLELDDVGYIQTRSNSVETSVEGVFAAGDVQDHDYRQAITAAGTGCMAAMQAERWLSANDLVQEFHQPVSPESHNDAENVSQSASQPSEAASAGQKTRDKAEPKTFEEQAAEFDPLRVHHAGSYALRKLYHESDRLIVVKYASPTCGPCHTLKPILEKAIDEFGDRVHYVEIDITEDMDIARSAGIAGTPTVQMFKQRALMVELKGVKQKSQYRDQIQKQLEAVVV